MRDFSSKRVTVFGLILTSISVLTSIGEVRGGTITCNKDNALLCYNRIRNTTFNNAIPYASDLEVAVFCRRFSSFETCYNPVRSSCLNQLPFVMAVELEGTYSSYSFMCNEGAEDYALAKTCFSKDDLQREAQQCLETFKKQIVSSNSQNDTILWTKQTCEAGNIYIKCVDNYVDVMCQDERALKWINTFNVKSFYPLLSSLVCPGFEPSKTSNSGPSTSLVIMAVFLGLFFVIIILVIIILLWFCVKKRYYRNIACIRSLMERVRKDPPPYLPPNCNPPRNNHNNASLNTSENYRANNSAPIEYEYFGEGSSEHQTKETAKSCFEACTNMSYQEEFNKNVSQTVLFKPKPSDSSGKSCSTELSKDSGASCSSTPSTHFEPPTSNPFTRCLSISNSNLDELKEQEDIVQDYY